MALDSYEDIKRYVLSLGDEATDDTSDFDTDVEDALREVWRELWSFHPWLDLVTDPPGAFVTADDITTLTITVASTGTAVSGTLSAAPSGSVSISGRKIRPSGKNWITRVTAHTADSTTVTLDAVPETLAAGTAITIFQDEYTLAADLGTFVDGLWGQGNHFVELLSEEQLKKRFPDPPDGSDTPSAFCRLTRRKIRLSEYPQAIRRYEYPYVQEPSDPSGTGTLALGAHLRPVFARGALAALYEMKSDRRLGAAVQRYQTGIERAIAYERRRRTGWTHTGSLVGTAVYGA